VADLAEEIVRGRQRCRGAVGKPRINGLQEKDLREAKRKFEIAFLLKQLGAHRWNISRTAATIGLHRQSLQEKMRELGIRRPGRDPLRMMNDAAGACKVGEAMNRVHGRA